MIICLYLLIHKLLKGNPIFYIILKIIYNILVINYLKYYFLINNIFFHYLILKKTINGDGLFKKKTNKSEISFRNFINLV